MLRWIVGGVFVAVMIVVWFLARAVVDNLGIAGTGAWPRLHCDWVLD
jgi:hypothetical protein